MLVYFFDISKKYIHAKQIIRQKHLEKKIAQKKLNSRVLTQQLNSKLKEEVATITIENIQKISIILFKSQICIKVAAKQKNWNVICNIVRVHYRYLYFIVYKRAIS